MPENLSIKTLTFSEIVEPLLIGKRIYKEEWDEEVYGLLDNEFLKIHLTDGKNHEWLISQADLESEDYYII